MTDTIELLEAIGSDASLRYARADALTRVLEQAQAGAELTAAVALSDSAILRMELDLHQVPQIPQSPIQLPGQEDEEEEGIQPEDGEPSQSSRQG